MLKATTTVPAFAKITLLVMKIDKQKLAEDLTLERLVIHNQMRQLIGQRQFTLNGQVIQVLGIINPSNGYGGQPVTNSNTRVNHSNSTVVNVNEPAANGAGAFTIDHVVEKVILHIMQVMQFIKHSYT